MPPFLSAPKAPNRSAVKGLAAAARKRKAAGEKHGQYKKAAQPLAKNTRLWSHA